MDDLENELDNFIKSRNNKNTERDELNKQMKILKEKFRQLRKKILVIKVFDKQSKDIILKDIEKIIENGENKFFNLTNDISTEASISFCNELVIKLYTYEQSGYKIKNQITQKWESKLKSCFIIEITLKRRNNHKKRRSCKRLLFLKKHLTKCKWKDIIILRWKIWKIKNTEIKTKKSF